MGWGFVILCAIGISAWICRSEEDDDEDRYMFRGK